VDAEARAIAVEQSEGVVHQPALVSQFNDMDDFLWKQLQEA
jgi:hypothetical protein